jgi:hypothetical protein
MKVFELMHELGKLPANAEVRFHTLADVGSIPTYEDDEDMYELDYEVSGAELLMDGDEVQLSD